MDFAACAGRGGNGKESFRREHAESGVVERKVEAMGSEGVKIRAAQPPSGRLATLLRPVE